jgi:hypothetical protein
MQIYNAPARAERNSDWGHVWLEVITNGTTTGMEVARYAAVRVRAVAGTTVSFDGVLAATMIAGEILIFNSGIGQVAPGGASANKKTVTLVVTGSSCVQVAAQAQNEVENHIPTPVVP